MDGNFNSATNQALLARALQYGTPLTMPYIQNDEMTNQALASMLENGSQNLKSPLALGSNLLATALDAYSSRHAARELGQRTMQDQAGYDAALRQMGDATGAFGVGQNATPGGT